MEIQIENSGLLRSAVLVIGPENEKLFSESKLFTIVNTTRITKFRREQSDTVNGILKKINHCSLKYLSVDCCVNMDSTLLIPFFSNLSEIHLTGTTIRDTVLVTLMDEFVQQSDFTLNTLTLDCRVINTKREQGITKKCHQRFHNLMSNFLRGWYTEH